MQVHTYSLPSLNNPPIIAARIRSFKLSYACSSVHRKHYIVNVGLYAGKHNAMNILEHVSKCEHATHRVVNTLTHSLR